MSDGQFSMAAQLKNQRGSKVVLSLLEKHGISRVFELIRRTREGDNRQMYLGLDISTKSTGLAVVDGSGKLRESNLIQSASKSCLLDVAGRIEDKLNELSKREHVEWSIGIEEFMKTYHTGRFHTQGLFQLARLNGIVSYSCFKHFGCKPVHVHPSTARSAFDLNRQASDDKPIKHVVLQFANELNPLMSIESYDIADAFVMARYMYLQSLVHTMSMESELKRDFMASYALKNHKRLSTKFNDDKKKLETYLEGVYLNGIDGWIRLALGNNDSTTGCQSRFDIDFTV